MFDIRVGQLQNPSPQIPLNHWEAFRQVPSPSFLHIRRLNEICNSLCHQICWNLQVQRWRWQTLLWRSLRLSVGAQYRNKWLNSGAKGFDRGDQHGMHVRRLCWSWVWQGESSRQTCGKRQIQHKANHVQICGGWANRAVILARRQEGGNGINKWAGSLMQWFWIWGWALWIWPHRKQGGNE